MLRVVLELRDRGDEAIEARRRSSAAVNDRDVETGRRAAVRVAELLGRLLRARLGIVAAGDDAAVGRTCHEEVVVLRSRRPVVPFEERADLLTRLNRERIPFVGRREVVDAVAVRI